MKVTRVGRFAASVALACLLAGSATGSGTAPAASTIACPSATPAAALPTLASTPQAAPAPAFPAEGGSLTVFAAASLTDAFTGIGDDLEAANPGLEITFNFAGSQALLTQLASGAPADVFAPADLSRMAAAREAGLISGEPAIFASNRLAVAVPAANPAGIDDPSDLAAEGVKLVLALPEVPAGAYAREAICRMGDAAFVDAVAANIVSEEEDARDVLAKVEIGEADAGIVYLTDAKAGGESVLAIPIPAAANPAVAYPIAAIPGGDEALAGAFIGYVLGPEGQATLAEYGFGPAGA